MGVALGRVGRLEMAIEAHHAVGGCAAVAAADGDTGAEKAVVEEFGEGRNQKPANAGRGKQSHQERKRGAQPGLGPRLREVARPHARVSTLIRSGAAQGRWPQDVAAAASERGR